MNSFRVLFSLCSLCLLCAGAVACAKSDTHLPFDLPMSEIAPLEFYFTRPEPGAGESRRHAPRRELLRLVNEARESIHMWCYGFNDDELIEALVRAKTRGVRIRITGSPERDYGDIRVAGLDMQTRASSGLQHVKLLIFDREIIYSGTGNFTRSGFFYNNNAFWKARLPWGAADALIRGLDGPVKKSAPDSGPIDVSIPGTDILIAPRSGRLIQTRIIQAILSARTSIAYMSFSHTDPLINAALFLAARRGVLVEGIHDYENLSANSRGRELNDAAGLLPLTLYRDGNRTEYESSDGIVHGGHLHHKTLIIDGARVLTGSYNWSLSARDKNLEILFDLENAGPFFREEFERIRARAELMPRPWSRASAGATGAGTEARFVLRHGPEPMLCSSDAPGAGLIRFAGHGPYFRGEYLPPAKPSSTGGSEACRPWAKFAKMSAGPRGLVFPHGVPEELRAIRGPGGTYIAWIKEPEQLPCEDPVLCRTINIKRAWKKDGLLLLENGVDFQSARFLGGGGLGPMRELREVGRGLFYFDPADLPAGDLAVFLRDSRGREYAACLRSGTNFTGPARDVLEAMSAIRNEKIECAGLE